MRLNMENTFISESDSKQNLTLDMFAPISLSGPENEEFNDFLFPKASGGKGIPKMGDLLGMLQELSVVATNVNLLYGVLADTIHLSADKYLQRGAITDMPWGEPGYQDKVSLNDVPPEKAAAYIRNKYENRINAGLRENDEKFSLYMQFVKKGAITENGSSIYQAKQHIPFIIKPQGKGFDILWVGNSGYSYGNSPLLGVTTTYPKNSNLVTSENSSLYQQGELEKYRTPIAKSAYESIIMLNNILTDGAANRVEDIKRSTKMLPLDFNFEQFENFTLPGLNAKILPDGVFKNISRKFQKYSKFFRILVVHVPNSELVSLANYKKLDTSKLNREFIITYPNISFSIAMHLPENIAHYVTQTEKNQKVSYSSLCQWVSLWSTEAFLPTAKKRGSQQTKYVVKASEVAKFAAKRKEAGLYVEKGSGDADNVFISNRGTLVYCPKADALEAIDNAVAYERECDAALEAFFDKGFCAKFDNDMFDPVMYASLSENEITKLKEQSNLIKARSGTLLTASWDYRQLVYAGVDPKDTKILNIGGVTPDALAIANYLTLPVDESLKLVTGVVRIPTRGGGEKAIVDEDGNAVVADDNNAHANLLEALSNDIIKLYDSLYAKGLVPSFQELVKTASEQLNITKLTDDKNKHEESVYYRLLTSELTEISSMRYDTEGKKIECVFGNVLSNCGNYGSLRNTLARTVDRHSLDEELHLSSLYFEKRRSNATDLKNTYKWLGGLIYLLSLQAIKKCDAKQIFAINEKSTALSAKQIAQRAMPYIVMLTSYIPKSDTILRKAQIQKEHNTANAEIGVEDLKIPGTSLEAKAFPHQINAHKTLRNKPRFAALDINAGGGKCQRGETLVHTSQGLIRLDELWEMGKGEVDADGFKQLKIGVMDHTNEYAQTDKVYKTSGKTIKITFSDGTEIEGLAQHKIWVYVEGTYQFLRLDELEKGDPAPKAIPTQMYGKYKKVQGIRVDEDFGLLLGYMEAEGFFDNPTRLLFCNTDSVIIENFKETWERVFGDSELLRATYDTERELNTGFECIKSKYAPLIKELCGVGKSADRLVPKVIRTSPKSVQCAFLRGYFEGDGTVYLRDNKDSKSTRWSIDCTSISKQVIYEMKAMLENLGILTRVYTRKTWATDGSENQVEKDSWILSIDTHSNSFDIFAEEIGFISHKKRKRLTKAMKHREWLEDSAQQNTNATTFGQYNNFPFGNVCESAKEMILAEATQHTYAETGERNGMRRHTRNSLRKAGYNLDRKMFNSDGWCNRFAIQRLNNFVKHGPESIVEALADHKLVKRRMEQLNHAAQHAWITVTNIEYKNTVVDVYDISVPGNHSYVCNNIYSHNTIVTLADIACTIRECSAVNESIKPIVVCPDGLIKNWCEDMMKLTGSNWNMIPINTDIAKRWGYKRLDSILRDAPPNTIVVVSMSYLAMAESYTVVIGGKEVRSSHALEFIKNYGFNYIACDEAHRLKNTATKIHQFCKDIANSSVVKYVRLLSGTMIPKDVKDIVGIAAMFSGQIFRTKEEFGSYIDSLAGNNSTALDRKRLGLKQVRERFKDNIALIRTKRKEWAFLLPSPIETFIPVYLSYAEDETNWRNGDPEPEKCTNDERLISQAHREIYEAVLNEEGERVKSLLGTETEDDDEEFEALTGKYNFQRIDRITMDPESDPFGQEIMQKLRDRGIDTESFVPRKIKECIKRLDLHYAPNEWSSGEYQSSDIVDYKGETYIARKREGSSKFTSTFPPDKDQQTSTNPNGSWKKEKRGKVLILCQYTDSITSLFDRLPEKYQDMTVKIYKHNSKRQNKSNLNAFMKNDKVQIIICQADRVTEGFNLQMCSRLIRIECPWTPGAIEQSNARLFRPEVKKDGSRREYIYLDWIVTDATLEVVKVGKLYNRTLSNCQYEESDNTDGKDGANLYESIMNVVEQPMRLNKYLLGKGKDKYPMFSDLLGEPVDENGRPIVTVDPMTGKPIKYCNMNTYAEYATIRNAEFEAMRKSGKDQDLVRLITVDAPANFKHLAYVPYDFRQEIPDPYGFDYVQLMDFLEDDENKAYVKVIKDLVSTHGLIEKATRGKKSMATRFGGKAIGAFNGMKAHFEGGYGVITSLYVKYDPKVPDAIPVMKVTITNKGIVNTVDANAVYVIPGKLNAAAEAIFNGSRPIFEDEKGGRNAIIIDGEAVEKGKRGKNQVTLDEEDGDLPPAILDDYDEEDEDNVVAPPVATEPVIPTVTITPVVYDRFVGIEVEGEAIDDIREALSGVGVKFEYKNSYASINIFDRNELKAVVGYVRNNGFVLSDLCAKSIMSILQSSFTRESAAFNIETAPVRELASFYTRNHTMSKGKDLKMYPVISHGRLDLQIDLKTNVNFAPFIGKKIEGMKHGTKMFVKQRDNGMFLALAENKKQLFVIIGTIVKSKKLNISNIKTLKADFDVLKTHVAK